MSSDLSVTRVGVAAATTEVARQPGARLADQRTADRAPAPPPPAGKSLPNPTLRLDPGLAIVVIEFRDETGAVRSTIPTEQQLDAYRSWERGNIGEPRPGRRAAADGGTPPPGTGAPGTGPPDTAAPAAGTRGIRTTDSTSPPPATPAPVVAGQRGPPAPHGLSPR